MAKRLTDTDKWKDDWFVSLSNDYRIIWLWLLDNCNHAGICKRSIGLLNRDCNTKISENELVEALEGRLLICGNNWFIPKFLKFQYANLTSDRPVIISVVKELEKNNLSGMIPESFGNDYLIIKDKDKDINKGKSTLIKKHNKANETEKKSLFDSFYDGYGKKVGKSEAQKAWMKLKVDEMPAIIEAAKKYSATVTDRQFQPYPASWLNGRRWEDEPTNGISHEKCPLGNPIDRTKHPDWPADKPYTPSNITRYAQNWPLRADNT